MNLKIESEIKEEKNPELENKEEKVINNLIEYVEENKKSKLQTSFILSVVCYIISIFIFLYYLKIDYQNIELVSK